VTTLDDPRLFEWRYQPGGILAHATITDMDLMARCGLVPPTRRYQSTVWLGTGNADQRSRAKRLPKCPVCFAAVCP
jgi:hypothetical protein